MANIYDDVELLKEQIATLQTQMTAAQSQIAAMEWKTLESNVDLHTLTAGNYFIPSAEVSATIQHKPTTRTATACVIVKPAGNEGQLIMTYTICDKTTVVYYQCSYYTTGWGDWLEMDLTNIGWSDLSLSTGITAYNDAQKPRYCKVGKTVFITGVLKGITASDMTIATLPNGFRPNKRVIVPIACVGQMIAKISIDTNGDVVYNRSTVEPVIAENWHSIACSFTIN